MDRPLAEIRFDANGFAIDPVLPSARRASYSLFSADATMRLDEHTLAHRAQSLLGISLTLTPTKHFVHGTAPIADCALVTVLGDGVPKTALWIRSLPVERARPLRSEALEVAARMGGQGMDVMVKRAQKLIQVDLVDPVRASLACACVLSACFLGAILAPDEDAIFGIKGARERLAKLQP